MATLQSAKAKLLLILEYSGLLFFCLLPPLLGSTRSGADVATCIIGALFIVRSALTKDWRWLKRDDVKLIILFWLCIMTSALLSDGIRDSLTKSFIWGRFVLLYIAATYWILAKPEHLATVCRVGVLVLIFAAVDTFWQYKTGTSLTGRVKTSMRLQGAMSHLNAGNLLLKAGLPLLGMCIYLIMLYRKKWLHILSVALAFTLFSLIILSGERTSALLTVVGLSVTGLACFIFQKRSRKWVIGTAVVLALITYGLATTQEVVQVRTQQASTQMTSFEDTTYGQLYIASFKLWQQHPIFGVGPARFFWQCEDHKQELGVIYCDIHSHNTYLQWLVDTGLVGLTMFLLLMALIVFRTIRIQDMRGEAWVLTAFSAGIIVVLLFPFAVTQSVFSSWSGMLFWYSLSLAVSMPTLANIKQPGNA